MKSSISRPCSPHPRGCPLGGVAWEAVTSTGCGVPHLATVPPCRRLGQPNVLEMARARGHRHRDTGVPSAPTLRPPWTAPATPGHASGRTRTRLRSRLSQKPCRRVPKEPGRPAPARMSMPFEPGTASAQCAVAKTFPELRAPPARLVRLADHRGTQGGKLPETAARPLPSLADDLAHLRTDTVLLTGRTRKGTFQTPVQLSAGTSIASTLQHLAAHPSHAASAAGAEACRRATMLSRPRSPRPPRRPSPPTTLLSSPPGMGAAAAEGMSGPRPRGNRGLAWAYAQALNAGREPLMQLSGATVAAVDGSNS